MDIINYKGSRALFLDSNDLMKLDTRTVVNVMTPTEVAVRHIIENREALGISALIVVSSFDLHHIPKFLRDAIREETQYTNLERWAHCYRNEWVS